MSSDPAEAPPTIANRPHSAVRPRAGLALAIALGLLAAVIAYAGTRDRWQTAQSRPLAAAPAPPSDPAAYTEFSWDVTLPAGPHRDEFQSSCLTCHSAQLPFGQPPFPREKWAEIVHKMVTVYGAPMTAENESKVVDYMLAAHSPSR